VFVEFLQSATINLQNTVFLVVTPLSLQFWLRFHQICSKIIIIITVRRGVFSPSYRTHIPLVQKLRCQTPIKHTTNISEPLRISVKNSFILPDGGSHTIRNMSE